MKRNLWWIGIALIAYLFSPIIFSTHSPLSFHVVIVHAQYGDGGYPDGGYPDGGYPDGFYPDSGYPDSGYPDSGYPDSGYPDSSYPDAAYPDSGYPPSAEQAQAAQDIADALTAGGYAPDPNPGGSGPTGGVAYDAASVPDVLDQAQQVANNCNCTVDVINAADGSLYTVEPNAPPSSDGTYSDAGYPDGSYSDGGYPDGQYADGTYPSPCGVGGCTTGDSTYADGTYTAADATYFGGDSTYFDASYTDSGYGTDSSYFDSAYVDASYPDGFYGDNGYFDGCYSCVTDSTYPDGTYPVSDGTYPPVDSTYDSNYTAGECNTTCAFNSDCKSNLCYLGACRNSACQADATCACSGSCSGCQSLQSGTCKDNNFLCPSNDVCISGFCETKNPFEENIQPPSGFTVSKVSSSETGTQTGPNTFSFSPSSSAPITINWCLAPSYPGWFQVESGDVRFSALSNSPPSGKYVSYISTNPTTPNVAVLFSSDANTDLGTGASSYSPTGAKNNWVVNKEYEANHQSTLPGSASYSFYQLQAAKNNVTIKPICSGSESNCVMQASTFGNSSQTGIFRVGANATLTGPGFSVPPNTHIVLLADGDVTIKTIIVVPKGQGSLFILAAKGNITIDGSIGNSDPSIDNTKLDGFYTSEKSIVIGHLAGASCPSTPELRLNIGGKLIANAQYPFASAGVNPSLSNGQVINERSLCTADNKLYPTLKMYSRPDMILQLSDFYRTSRSTFQEIAP